MKVTLIFLIFFLTLTCNKPNDVRVVVVMVDGVRTQEFFQGVQKDYKNAAKSKKSKRKIKKARKKLFPFIWKFLGNKRNTFILGDPKKKQECRVDNESIKSMPAYANFFAAKNRNKITDNDFKGDLPYDTIIDQLVSDKIVKEKEIGIFSSWRKMQYLLMKEDHDNVKIAVDRSESEPKPPWPNARFDRETFKDSLANISKSDPYKFLFVGFTDADEYAHDNDYGSYLESLRDSDFYMRLLYEAIESNDKYRGDIIYVFATDHGRGAGENWTSHGEEYPASKKFWAVVNFPKGKMKPSWMDEIKSLKKDCTHSALGRFVVNVLSKTSNSK